MKPDHHPPGPMYPLVLYSGTGGTMVPTGIKSSSPSMSEGGSPGPNSAQQDALIQEISRSLDIRSISPRHMGDVSMDLYMGGILSWEEYSMLAFQPELHPDYDKTIGALLGKKAEPDRKRDFVSEWEERLNFEMKYNAGKKDKIKRATTIFRTLYRIATIKEVFN